MCGGEGPRISVRDAPQKEKFRSILSVQPFVEKHPLSVPYLQLWSLIENWIYYALKSHLEMWEGMTAPASPSQIETDRRATSNGRARSVPSVSATGGICAISAPFLFFGKNRNSDGLERCSTTVPQMLRATTAHLWSFFHINMVGPCPVFIKVGCRRQEPERWETPHSATRRGRRGYFACRAMVVGIRSRRSATKGGAG